jgi:hypothetical protein
MSQEAQEPILKIGDTIDVGGDAGTVRAIRRHDILVQFNGSKRPYPIPHHLIVEAISEAKRLPSVEQ